MAYIAVGLWLLRAAKALPGSIRFIGPVVLAVGITSFAFHASYTAFFQFFDYVGMFLLAALFLVIDLERVGWSDPSWGKGLVLGLTAASAGVFLLFRGLGWPVQLIMVGQAAALIALELFLARQFGLDEHRPLWAALGLLAAGLGFWLSDYTRLVCDPDNHLYQGHAVWHLLGSAALVYAFRFYRQFPPTHSLRA